MSKEGEQFLSQSPRVPQPLTLCSSVDWTITRPGGLRQHDIDTRHLLAYLGDLEDGEALGAVGVGVVQQREGVAILKARAAEGGVDDVTADTHGTATLHVLHAHVLSW